MYCEINQCCICLNDILDDKAPKFSNCTHNENVHLKCIMEWNKPSCPICRRENCRLISDTYYSDLLIFHDYVDNLLEPELYIEDYASIILLQQTFITRIEEAVSLYSIEIIK